MRTTLDIDPQALALIRAEASARGGIDVFQPLDPSLQALTVSLKQAFDPVGILNPGRFVGGI